MNPVRPDIKFTYHDYLLLPEEKQYELINGELFMVPAPRPYHQVVSLRFKVALSQSVKEHHLGEVLDAPCDVYFSSNDVVQPDILFVSSERLGIIKENYIQGAPDLVIEILSPSSLEKDRELKRKLYSLHGVREYWIVDPDARSVDLLTRQEGELKLLQTYVVDDQLKSPLLQDFQLALKDVFLPLRGGT